MRSQFHRQRIVRAASLALLVALSAACGDDSKQNDAATDSPISELFGGNISPAESRRKELAVEEATAQCMKEAGWEYKPVDYSGQVPQGASADENLSPKELGEKYAYGVVHNYELYELPSIGSGDGGGPVATIASDFVDPNQDYVGSLSSDEQADYYKALDGDYANFQPTIDTVTGEQVFNPPPIEQQGCHGKSRQKVYGDQPFNDPDFSKRFEELSQKLQKDPRVLDAEDAWGECVFKINPDFDLAASQDAYQYMDSLMQKAKGLKVVPADPQTGQPIGGDGTEEVYSSMTDASGKSVAYIGKPKAIEKDRLEELRATEKELWNADQKCQKQVGLAKIRKDAEQELVDTLRQEFPDLQQNQS